MKNIKLAALLGIVFLTFSTHTVHAQEGSIKTELKEYTQDPESKAIKHELILQSEVRSDNVRITWSVRGAARFENNSTSSVIRTNIEPSKSYEFPIYVTPNSQGTVEITARVEVFQIDGTITSTVRSNFATNTYSEKLPLTDEYNQAKTISSIKNIIVLITALGAGSTAIYFGYKKLKSWYSKTPELDFRDNI